MAAQQIPLTGTGEILIKYTESSVEKSLRVLSPTTGLYLNDANTGFKYKVLSGSVTIGSTGSITFTQIVTSYRELIWDITLPYGETTYQIKELIIGAATYAFATPISIRNPISISTVVEEIYNLSIPTVVPTSFKEESTNVVIGNTQIATFKYNLILSITDLVGDVYLKINNTATSAEYLIKAVSAAEAVPAGYTESTSPCNKSELP